MITQNKEQNKNKTVFVAMSGGVDSSVVAGMIKEQGYNTIGGTMCFNISHTGDSKPSCCGVAGIEDARRAAQVLDIPHYVFNFADVIDEKIIGNFTDEYMNGRTPNPCVQCNQHLKFGALYQKVKSLGADYLATGHYSKIHYSPAQKRFELKKGNDPYKDQSYFLYSMHKDTLPSILFPLGDLTKTEVRELARKYGLPNAEKPGSQDICFVPSSGYKTFLENRLGKENMVPGPFKDEEGNVLGEHKGIAYYTIGQRDKLGLSLGRPVYVYKIEKETNTVYVGDESRLYADGLIARRMNFVSADAPFKNLKVKVRIRYNQPELSAYVTSLDKGSVEVRFENPQKSVTPGQSVVFYEGDVVLAGGIIDHPVFDRQPTTTVA